MGNLNRASVSVIVLACVSAILLCGCLGEQNPLRKKAMSITITNLKAETYGLLDVRAKISCDVINYGDPGYVTVHGYINQGGKLRSEEEKRVHVSKNEQVAVTFDLDVEVGEFQYNFDYSAEDPD